MLWGKPYDVSVSSSGQQGLVESLPHRGNRSHEVTAAITLPEGRARKVQPYYMLEILESIKSNSFKVEKTEIQREVVTC